MWRVSGGFLRALMVSGVVWTGQPAQAQDAVQAEMDIQVEHRPGIVVSDEVLERWIYGPGGSDQARQRFRFILAEEITKVDRMYGLTPEQKKKLEVAGRGDMKRLFDRAQEVIAMLHRTGRNVNVLRLSLWQYQPLPNNLDLKLFGKGSMFAKTLEKTLTLEQRARHEQERRAVYRSRVEWMVSQIHAQLRFSDEQRRRFVDAIVAETRPPEKYGKYDFLALLFRASRLPEARLKPICNEAQWRLIRHEFDQVRRQEKFLISLGYLTQEEAAVAPPAGVDGRVRRAATGARIEPLRRGRTGFD